METEIGFCVLGLGFTGYAKRLVAAVKPTCGGREDAGRALGDAARGGGEVFVFFGRIRLPVVIALQRAIRIEGLFA